MPKWKTTVQPPLTLSGWLRHDAIRDAFDDVPEGARVLEIGPGLGAMGARIARDHRYVGVEMDPTARKHAQELVAPYGGIVHDSLTDVTGPFDVVCAFEVLEHIEDDRGALEQWQEVSGEGGMLVLSVPAWSTRFGPWDKMVGHYRRYDPASLCELLEGVGFHDTGLRLYGFPVTPVTEWIRHRVAARRTSQSSLAERTASSGQLLQPGRTSAFLTFAVAWMQGRLRNVLSGAEKSDTGLVVTARKPS